MPEQEPVVNPEKTLKCAGCVCEGKCDKAGCVCEKLDKDTAALVAEFSERETGA